MSKSDESMRVLDPDGDEEGVVVVDTADEAGLVEVNAPEVGLVGRFFMKVLPFLAKECPFGNKHWRWDSLCACGFGAVADSDEDVEVDGWHGGVLDLKAGVELAPCAHCNPELSPHNHQWALDEEEEKLLISWRAYREQYLEHFGDNAPYRYEITVKLNNVVQSFLMSRTQGLQQLASGQSYGYYAAAVPPNDKPN